MLSAFSGLSQNILVGSFLFFVVLLVLTSGTVVVLLVQNSRMKQKMAIFFSGKEAKDLEKVLLDQLKETRALDGEIQELFEISNRLRELGMKSLHKSAVLRFNPFREVGGNQSFTVALLDGKNTGMLISSLHTREGTRVYAKPVLLGSTDGFPFTDEEKAVIHQAINGKPTVAI